MTHSINSESATRDVGGGDVLVCFCLPFGVLHVL